MANSQRTNRQRPVDRTPPRDQIHELAGNQLVRRTSQHDAKNGKPWQPDEWRSYMHTLGYFTHGVEAPLFMKFDQDNNLVELPELTNEQIKMVATIFTIVCMHEENGILSRGILLQGMKEDWYFDLMDSLVDVYGPSKFKNVAAALQSWRDKTRLPEKASEESTESTVEEEPELEIGSHDEAKSNWGEVIPLFSHSAAS